MGFGPLLGAALVPSQLAIVGPLDLLPLGDDGEESDPLAIYDDDFPGASLDAQWSFFDEAHSEITVSGAEAHCSHIDGGVGESLWYSGFDGWLAYIEFDGDFDVAIDTRVTADDGVSALTNDSGNYRVAALMAHDPDRGDARNYVSVGIGAISEATLRAEWKSTVNDESDSGVLATGDFDSIAHASGEGTLRIVREGPHFSLYVNDTLLNEFDRADLPSTLQVGFTFYSNQASTPGMGHFGHFRVRTP